ncbi:MAG: hypothetical protein IPH13_03035 [Planctomycetes bacterium]|nr:hypothetical protein [Planctomycetota bacterium]MCC7170409.1 hypothetical protein [Planctomycetota bacterium]
MVPSDLVLANTAEQREPSSPNRRESKGVAAPLPRLDVLSPDPLFGTTDRYKIAVPLLRPEELPDSRKNTV